MATYIKPTLTITSNKNSATTNKGPLSIGLSLSASASLNVDDVRSRIVAVNQTEATLLDGDLISGGDGLADAVGGYLYLKNISPASTTNYIAVGIIADNGNAADLTASGDVARVMTLMPGEFAFFPYDLTMDITVDSNQNDGTQKIEYWYFDRA
tara:strand:- start:811 stop:1272 length:462 start_codon:yes stop_codon:yes gene_type:complete